MFTRSVVLVFALFVLLVEGDLDSNDAGIQATSTDKDSTSDEAPTESMNAVSPDQPDEPHYHGGAASDTSSSSSETPDASAANQETAPKPAASAANSVEEEDEDETSDSGEGGKKKFSSRSAKPPSPAQSHQISPRIQQSPAFPPIIPAHVVEIPALLPQPIIPQPKTLVRSRTSKRRSRTNRRQI